MFRAPLVYVAAQVFAAPDCALCPGAGPQITPGTLTDDMVPVYWESRWGTRAAPVIVEAADGAGTVTMANLNIYNT